MPQNSPVLIPCRSLILLFFGFGIALLMQNFSLLYILRCYIYTDNHAQHRSYLPLLSRNPCKLHHALAPSSTVRGGEHDVTAVEPSLHVAHRIQCHLKLTQSRSR